jgi:hypothetical protein
VAATSANELVFESAFAWHQDCTGTKVVNDLTGTRRLPHARRSVIIFQRIATFVAALAIGAGNVAVCAGWQPTADARMACCMNGTDCPMHQSDSHQHSSMDGVSQTQADSCCASAAERRDSTPSGSTVADSGVVALVPVDAVTATQPVFASQQWRALVPLPVSSTPKHLLLSVLLV